MLRFVFHSCCHLYTKKKLKVDYLLYLPIPISPEKYSHVSIIVAIICGGYKWSVDVGSRVILSTYYHTSGHAPRKPVILRDNTMKDILMYTSNFEKQNYPFYRYIKLKEDLWIFMSLCL